MSSEKPTQYVPNDQADKHESGDATIGMLRR